MKKLLLVALVAMGVTSFAAVEGTGDKVSLPIVATGEIVAKTTNLIIESTTAGMVGDEMKFDFGQVAANDTTSKLLEGTFRIARADATKDLADTGTGNYTTLKVGFDETAANQTATTTLNQGGNITINYSLGFVAPAALTAKEATGTVSATVTAADGVTPGVFTDRSQKIYVVLSK